MRRPVARPCGRQRKTVGPLCHLPTIIECHLCHHYVFLNFQLISNTFYNNRVALRLGYFSVTFCHIPSKNSHWKLVRFLNLFGTFTFLYFKFNCHHRQKLTFCYNDGTFVVPFWYAPAPFSILKVHLVLRPNYHNGAAQTVGIVTNHGVENRSKESSAAVASVQ